ncbi:MAG: hypothetical protein HYT11_04125 [Candidatus Levybacteria bacterium]|nr:hypothetical protein [Candidatus Levybacteria bacterium]
MVKILPRLLLAIFLLFAILFIINNFQFVYAATVRPNRPDGIDLVVDVTFPSNVRTNSVNITVTNEGKTSINLTDLGIDTVRGTYQFKDASGNVISTAKSFPIFLRTKQAVIGEGQGAEIVLPIDPVPSGAEKLVIIIDQPNQVTEINENNNTWEGEIDNVVEVAAKPVDLILEQVTFPTGSSEQNKARIMFGNMGSGSFSLLGSGISSVTGSYQFLNQGGTAIGSSRTFVFLSETNRSSLEGAGETRIGKPSYDHINIDVVLDPIPQEATSLRVILDDPNQIAESDEGNNVWSGPFTAAFADVVLPDLTIDVGFQGNYGVFSFRNISNTPISLAGLGISTVWATYQFQDGDGNLIGSTRNLVILDEVRYC